MIPKSPAEYVRDLRARREAQKTYALAQRQMEAEAIGLRAMNMPDSAGKVHFYADVARRACAAEINDPDPEPRP